MSVRKAYSSWSTTYDTDRNPTRDLDQTVTRDTFAGQHFETILETGCGTGKNSTFLAQIADQVLALDFSEGMIAQARAKTQVANVQFAQADFTQTWPCADGSVNLIVCNLVLEHIENLAHVFAEAQRVLAEGGKYFVCELHPFKQYQGKKAVFERGEEQIAIPAFVHHTSDFFVAGQAAGFQVTNLREWWHAEDTGLPPRLISFIFER
ncbi:MAG: class I SAM-dependent methyltransferase [Chloroflexota bacterium]